MSPSGKEEGTKKTGLLPEPLCLFCYPEEISLIRRKTYVANVPKEEPESKSEFWTRKRREARIRRRKRTKEPARHLKTFLLASVKNENAVDFKSRLPSMFEVLETVKDAWTSPSAGKPPQLRNEDTPKPEPPLPVQSNMKDVQLLSRRLSVPEELMRKYSVSKDETDEESETNKTAIEISPSSSGTLETARRLDVEKPEKPIQAVNSFQRTAKDEGKVKKCELPKRVTQNDFYEQGKRIILVKADTCTCRTEKRESSTTASAKEETDESGTSESVPSSSPTQLPKRESPFSSSEILSSESDNVRCTCRELSSKETSTDFHLSGKSTLSQTVSDKSISTQDSTVSINSVSTGGSTDDSNSTTPERERTSAKETTTSPDYSPRTPRNRKNRRRDMNQIRHHGKTCPARRLTSQRRCPMHEGKQNAATNTEEQSEVREFGKLTNEELYMMQQLRHRKFIESQRKPPSPTPEPAPSSSKADDLDEPVLIPRYSALPRSLSMLVNTSSPDNSDTESLADSLEDQPTTVHVHKLYDTKNESKPVRGDVNLVQETKFKYRQPRGRAFFVSMEDPDGEMLENIEKIPQPPEKIKNQIFERHLSLCAKHKRSHEEKTTVKSKKTARKKQLETKVKVKEEIVKPKPDKQKTRENSTDAVPQPADTVRDNAEKSLQKPQAVIHPSHQAPTELTVTPPRVPQFRQPWNKQVALARRSPVARFRQRFEVIPEEKSSSLSSAEEKKQGKVADASTSPLPGDKLELESYNASEVPNLLVAKITERQVETLPYVDSGNDSSRKIILFSSKSQNSNSSKGRDALIAMNREDFNRLAKGWMNFYKLNEAALNTLENEDKTETSRADKENKSEKRSKKHPELEESVRLDCSNTILKPIVTREENKNVKKENLLPEIRVPSQRKSQCQRTTTGSLPKVGKLSDDETDTDSTDYMEPPSPRVPPLSIEDASLSSSESELNLSQPPSTTQSLKYLRSKKKPSTNRTRFRNSLETSRIGKKSKKNSGWSVTVAGTVELSRSAPDLEMRLSFPAGSGPPVVSQSDSGFAEDSNYSKGTEGSRGSEPKESSSERKWMLTVNRPDQGKKEPKSRQSTTRLPGLEAGAKNPKEVLKNKIPDEKVRRLIEKKILRLWPEVQKVIKKEFVTESGRLITEAESESEECLTVRGNAVALGRKGKPRKETEKGETERKEAAPPGFT